VDLADVDLAEVDLAVLDLAVPGGGALRIAVCFMA